MKIAIIPARGGSKRIPRKNIRPFGGRPMIAWPIAAALETGLFDRVIVSTDDPEIAQTALDHGAEVPFMRPPDLADDFTPTRAVINHAIKACESGAGSAVDMACCIYATSGFLEATDLIGAHDLLNQDPAAGFVFAALHFPHPPQRALCRGPDGGVAMLHPEHATTRSQDLCETFHDAAQFYWGRRDAFVSGAPMFSAIARPWILPRDRALDIDTPDDWDWAERLLALRRAAGERP
jgi:N-acylneuraminate cytidylyltransferase